MTDLRALAVFVVFAASACQRPNDLPRRQDEVLVTVAQYQSRFEELKRRIDALELRRSRVPQTSIDAASAEHALSQARAVVEEQRSLLRSVPRMVPEWTRQGGGAELRKQLDELRERLSAATTEAGAELAAVEGWLAVAEQQRHPGAPPPPTTEAGGDERPAEPEAAPAPGR